MNTFEKIYNEVKKIPKGKVAAYSTIATMAGNKHWSRVVGFALHVNPDPSTIPCHRVVHKDGSVSRAFAFGGYSKQIELLKAEGVGFINDKVKMDKYEWSGYDDLKYFIT